MVKHDQKKWNSRYLKNIGSPTPSDFLSKYLSFPPKGRALDIACGNGRNSIFLAQHGFKVDAVDISNVALSQLPENASPTLSPSAARLWTDFVCFQCNSDQLAEAGTFFFRIKKESPKQMILVSRQI